MTYRITCVCLGNICRSPMAEAVLRDRVGGLDVTVDSAGTSGWHAGGTADERAQATLADAGYSLNHSARQFDPGWFATADLVLAMDRTNLADLVALAREHGFEHADIRLLRSFDPQAPTDAEVPDPYYGGNEGFVRALELIERAADGVVDHLMARGQV